jgi:hypothetical protein
MTTAVSAGIALGIEQASDASLDAGTRWALACGAALYLACVTTAQRATTQGVLRGTERVRGIAIGLLVVLAFVGGRIEPVMFTAIAAGTIFVLVAYKLWSTQRLRRVAT